MVASPSQLTSSDGHDSALNQEARAVSFHTSASAGSREPSPSPLNQSTLRYPSAYEDYIGSYYYGAYDDKAPVQGVNEDLVGRYPSSTHLGQSSARQNATMEEVIQGVSLRAEAEPAVRRINSPLLPYQRQVSQTIDRHSHTSSSLLLGSVVRPFPDSPDPDEMVGAQYLAENSRDHEAGPSRPSYRRNMTGASSQSSHSTGGGQWVNNQLHEAEMSGAAKSNAEETLDLRTHGAPRGYVRDDASQREVQGNDLPFGARRRRSVVFGTPQVAYFSSPLTVSPDLEEPPGERGLSSADGYVAATARTSYGPSAVDQVIEGLDRISKSIRRISRRVANGGDLDSVREGGHIRLIDEGEEDEHHDGDSKDSHHAQISAEENNLNEAYGIAEPLTALQLPMLLRGRSLTFMGPEHRFRRGMAKLLNYWWVEPFILLLIITHAITLIVQSSRDVFRHPRPAHYFGNWEDYVIFAIFCIYTIELLVRIVVSGLIINPPPLHDAIEDEDELVKGRSTTHTHVASPATPSHPPRPAVDSTEDYTERMAMLNRRRMSKSNTLDAFAELGDSIKTRAQTAFRSQDVVDSQRHGRPVPSRKSTAASTKMGLFEIDAKRSLNTAHQRSDTVFTTATEKSTATTTPFGVGVLEDDTAFALPRSGTSVLPTKARPGMQRQDSSHILQKLQQRAVPFVQAMIAQRAHAPHYAYLRHSFNRVDFVSIVAFWVSFALAVSQREATEDYHIYIFRAISVLRLARLLAITSGTTTILHSLKIAAPLLLNVMVFTSFAMVLFSIIGIQSFKRSYRRSCVWEGDLNSGINSDPGVSYTLGQICGGWYGPLEERMPYIRADGIPAPGDGKGFFCPIGQRCIEGISSPFEDTQSFDNILTSLLEVVIIISSNGWSDAMYDMIDADYFVSVFYFVIGIIFLNFWLANLFVAVITNSFATISAQTHQSAFAAKSLGEQSSLLLIGGASQSRKRRKKAANIYKKVWAFTKYFWLAAIVANLGSQASRTAYQTSAADRFVEKAELWFTIAFDIELMLRFLAYLLDDDWRSFYLGGGVQGTRNIVDTILCVLTSIMEIPAIRDSRVYAWMTIFQLQRFYRVIVAIPRIEALLLRVFGSMGGLLNMIAFLLFMVGLAAIAAVQMFRGDIPAEYDGDTINMNFKHIYNSFLAMYEIFSSENWNTILFNVLQSEISFKQTVVSAIFICGWFLFSNFIVLQMFVAVINEGFSISEAEMRKQQLDRYVRRLEPGDVSVTGRFLHKLSPYRWLKNHNASVLGQPRGQSDTSHPQQDVTNRALNAFDEKNERRRWFHRFINPSRVQRFSLFLRRLTRLDAPDQKLVPLDTVRQQGVRQSFSGAEVLRRTSREMLGEMDGNLSSRRQRTLPISDEIEYHDQAARLFARERQLTRIRTNLGLTQDEPTQSEINAAYVATQKENPRIAMAKAINAHPSFDKSLWVFTNHSSFRRFCQSLVPASYGERIFGRQHDRRRYLAVRIVMLLTIIASVVVVGVASPIYRKAWYHRNGYMRGSWFSLVEVLLSSVFFIEFFIKIVADGFAFTPNAYLLSPWNLLDLVVLASLVVNVTSEIVVIGGVSRFTRALKACRALRLINLSERMRSTFENLISGSGRFLDASALAILYIIPFAVWGQNLFSGILYSCNDSSGTVREKRQCVGEFEAQPSEWTFLAPRVWGNPTDGSAYSFDDFQSALLILFEIVSLEGWTSVMHQAMAIVGINEQPVTDHSQENALYFVVYNLMGAVFILTLFVSVIISGFQSATGAAFLSTEQRQWIDLKRLIARQTPAKRPAVRPTGLSRGWCFDRATKKHDWWGRFMTCIYLANVIVLCTQSDNQGTSAEVIRDYIYLAFSAIYGVDIVIRLIGIGWSAFRRSLWCLYDLFIVVGIIGNTLPLLIMPQPIQVNVQLQKVFLTAATLKLVSKHNGLNQLFKTAIAGLPAIVSLLGLWLCFFLFFGLMFVEVFGLTKWGYIGPESYARNFSSLPLALIFLSMMSTGEGWNAYMHDYTIESPACTSSSNYLESDCGSKAWAFPLFIAWNLVSMYIFLNMFTGTVVENFAYVFQLGGRPVLSREEMRGFKRNWLAVAGTSPVLPKDKLVTFLRALSGKFEMRLYPQDLSIRALREAALTEIDQSSIRAGSPTESRSRGIVSRLRGSSRSPTKQYPARDGKSLEGFSALSDSEHVIEGINVTRLRDLISTLDARDVQQRRERFNRVWHEACIFADESKEGKGLSFQDLLKIIAYHKFIQPETALSVEELFARRELDEKIDDRIDLERVRSVMKTAYMRYRFNLIRSERQNLCDALAHSVPSQDNGENGSTAPMDVPVPIIKLDATRSPPQVTRAGERPILRLDLDDLSAIDLADRVLRTPSYSTSPLPLASQEDRYRLSPSVTSHPSGSRSPSSARLTPVDVEELERRASPLLESFEGTPWGRMMNRMSEGVSRAVNEEAQQSFLLPSDESWPDQQSSSGMAEVDDGGGGRSDQYQALSSPGTESEGRHERESPDGRTWTAAGRGL